MPKIPGTENPFLARFSLLHLNVHSGVHGDEHLRSSLGAPRLIRKPLANYRGFLKRRSWIHDDSQRYLGIARLCGAQLINEDPDLLASSPCPLPTESHS